MSSFNLKNNFITYLVLIFAIYGCKGPDTHNLKRNTFTPEQILDLATPGDLLLADLDMPTASKEQRRAMAQRARKMMIYTSKETREKMLASNPSDVDALVTVGVYSSSTNPKRSIDLLSRAIRINPKYEEAWAFLGKSYVKIGNKSEAIKCYNKIASSNSMYGKMANKRLKELNGS